MLKIGLLGASRIAVDAIIAPSKENPWFRVESVAASTKSRAICYAKQHSIPFADSSYQSLCDNPLIDLVYIGLPPFLHKKWTIAALEAGKAVLCEKPFAMNSKEASQMVSFARQKGAVLLEAFHYRFHPLFKHVLQLVQSGGLGRLINIEACFNIAVPHSASEFRYDSAKGGGALMDLGCYPVHWLRTIANEEPQCVDAKCAAQINDVDVAMEADFVFPSGVLGRIACSMSPELSQRVDAHLLIEASDGQIFVDNPLQPELGSFVEVTDKNGSSKTSYEGATFGYQLNHLRHVLEGQAQVLTGGADAVSNMKVLDQVYRMAGLRPRGM